MLILLDDKDVKKYLTIALNIDESFIMFDEDGFFIKSDYELELALTQRKWRNGKSGKDRYRLFQPRYEYDVR